MAKNKDKVRRPRTRLLLPGQFHKSSTVVAPIKLAEGGILKGNIKYILDTWRSVHPMGNPIIHSTKAGCNFIPVFLPTWSTDGQWKIALQWIEQRQEGLVPIVIELPHQVVEAISRQRDQIVTESRKAGAKKAFETSKAKAHDRANGALPGNEVER